MIIIMQAIGAVHNQTWTKTQMQQFYKRQIKKKKMKYYDRGFRHMTSSWDGDAGGGGHQYLQPSLEEDIKPVLVDQSVLSEDIKPVLIDQSIVAEDIKPGHVDPLLLTGGTLSDREKAGRFPEGSWDILQEIIMKGEDGRFWEILQDRSPNANMAKADVWHCITELFNEVTIYSTVCTKEMCPLV
jgi:hypothetical protein